MIQAKYCTLEPAFLVEKLCALSTLFFWGSGKIVRAWRALFLDGLHPQLGAPRSIPVCTYVPNTIINEYI